MEYFRTWNILDLAVVQRNFIFTVAVAEAETECFRESLHCSSMLLFCQMYCFL